ncbi:substrate-binding periplasmic protein [Bdellovibrio sp. HCB337]|uniref:substrate-binding periplasmic protein n=1 Tax=Bdellovibrio sp. HCB337 TaxID=3394358 RepID=UPI0039A6E45A
MRKLTWCFLWLFWQFLPIVATAEPSQKFVVVVEDSDNYPFEYRENGRWTGYHIDIITSITKKLGWQVEWLAIPWPRAKSALEKREADAISYFITTPGKEEKDLVLLEDNILHHPVGVFFIQAKRKKELRYTGGGLEPLAKFTIGIIQGDVTDDFMTRYYPHQKVDKTAKNYEQLFKMLSENRFDLGLAHVYALRSISRTHPELSKQLTMIKTPFASSNAYIAFAKTTKGRENAQKFAKVFEAFKKTSSYFEITKKYGLESFSITKP